ncbi:phosphodiester glycosidase family protein [Runella sp.]|uniref:phosphodiester glycosidase family protein n=1 Tax=Runella sp. TaxID=1960881 RepID=UPI003D140CC1
MKPIVFLLLLTFTTGHAQTSVDSVAIHQAKWEIQEIAKGIQWRKTHFQQKELFNANQSINILEIPVKNRRHRWAVITADSLEKKDKAKGQLRPTSTLAKEHNALVAINGGFFDVKNGGSVDFIKVNGKIVDTTRIKKGQKAAFHGQAAIVVHRNRLHILKGQPTVGWEYTLPYRDVMLAGPLLMLNGTDEVLPKNAFNDNRHPRSCACVTNTKKVLLITVDGRSAESYGMNLAELTFLARQLGCRDALNLDGGGSTTLWIDGKGVVNYPSDNKKFDHEGERAVSNALVLKRK